MLEIQKIGSRSICICIWHRQLNSLTSFLRSASKRKARWWTFWTKMTLCNLLVKKKWRHWFCAFYMFSLVNVNGNCWSMNLVKRTTSIEINNHVRSERTKLMSSDKFDIDQTVLSWKECVEFVLRILEMQFVTRSTYLCRYNWICVTRL